MVAQSTKYIKVYVTGDATKTLRSIRDSLESLNKTTRTASVASKGLFDSFSRLQTMFAGYLGFGAISSLTQMADSVQLLRDRLKIVTPQGEDAGDMFAKIAGASVYTKTSLEGMAVAFTRASQSMKAYGISGDAILGISTALAQTFRISGSTAAETTGTIIQLFQGIGSGQLRGQELRTVLEQNVTLANILAETFSKELGGKGTAGLYKLAESGKLSVGKFLQNLIDNFDKLNLQAGKLNQTFGQSTEILKTGFSLVVQDISEKLGIRGAFATGVNWFIENLPFLSSMISYLGVAAIPALTLSIIALGKAIATFVTGSLGLTMFNPWILGATALSVAIYYIIKNFKELNIQAQIVWNTFQKYNPFHKLTGGAEVYEERLVSLRKELGILIADQEKKKLINPFSPEEMKKALQEAKGKIEEYTKTQEESSKKVGDYYEINNRYLREQISTLQYLGTVGSVSAQALKKEFALGNITLQEYYNKTAKLEDKFRPDSALFVGVQNYVGKLGSLTGQVATLIEGTMQRLEDSLFEFIKTGTFHWKKFIQGILDDILRVTIRMAVVKPLAEGLLSGFSGASISSSPATGVDSTAASRSVGVSYAAKGAVFDSPQLFAFGSGGFGNLGLLGEKGPESIMPLQRTANGDLGVKAVGGGSNVIVNVINNSSSVVAETRETSGPNGEKMIDVMIVEKTRAALASGKFDKVMSQSYGLNRRGA